MNVYKFHSISCMNREVNEALEIYAVKDYFKNIYIPNTLKRPIHTKKSIQMLKNVPVTFK